MSKKPKHDQRQQDHWCSARAKIFANADLQAWEEHIQSIPYSVLTRSAHWWRWPSSSASPLLAQHEWEVRASLAERLLQHLPHMSLNRIPRTWSGSIVGWFWGALRHHKDIWPRSPTQMTVTRQNVTIDYRGMPVNLNNLISLAHAHARQDSAAAHQAWEALLDQPTVQHYFTSIETNSHERNKIIVRILSDATPFIIKQWWKVFATSRAPTPDMLLAAVQAASHQTNPRSSALATLLATHDVRTWNWNEVFHAPFEKISAPVVEMLLEHNVALPSSHWQHALRMLWDRHPDAIARGDTAFRADVVEAWAKSPLLDQTTLWDDHVRHLPVNVMHPPWVKVAAVVLNVTPLPSLRSWLSHPGNHQAIIAWGLESHPMVSHALIDNALGVPQTAPDRRPRRL